MQHVDDAIDIAIAVIVTVIMMSTGVWCAHTINAAYSTPIYEKTAPLVSMSEDMPERELTVKELILAMVCNDEYCPAPRLTLISDPDNASKRRVCEINFNSAWFKDRDANINKKWDEFFKYCYDYNYTEWTPVYSGGKLQEWKVVIMNK